MPSGCGFEWSAQLDAIIRAEADDAGVPLDLAYAFIGAESAFNPAARRRSSIEDSVGLLQLNRQGGQGEGFSVAQLRDPRTNLQIGLPAIRRAYEQVWTPSIDPFEFIYQVAVRSGHPGAVDRADPRITRIANIWACFYPAAGLSLAAPGPAGGVVGGGGSVLAASMVLPLAAPAVMVGLLGVAGLLVDVGFNVARIPRLVADPRRVVQAQLFDPLDSITVADPERNLRQLGLRRSRGRRRRDRVPA